MKKKHLKTRHALLMSMISLMTCFAMLVGATFAWFTDSVTSGVNKIIAGNLDVEVYHKTSGEGTANPEEKVDGTTKLFTKDINGNDLLWEPEVIAYESFDVRNVGSLALKYALQLNNVGYNYVDGTGKWLGEVIKVAITDTAPTDRAAAQELFTTTSPTLATFVSSAADFTGLNADGELEPAAPGATTPYTSDAFTVVLYWPQSAADNNWNLGNINGNEVTSNDGNPLYVNLGITLVATQLEHEADSFDNTYDASATQPADGWAGVNTANMISTTASNTVVTDTNGTLVGDTTTYAAQKTTVTDAATSVSATVPASVLTDYAKTVTTNGTAGTTTTKETELELTVEPTSASSAVATVTTAGTTSTALYYDIDLNAITTTTVKATATNTVQSTSTDTEPVTSTNELIQVALPVGTNLDLEGIYHKTTKLTTAANADGEYYAYDPTMGILTLYVKTFSPFSIAYKFAGGLGTEQYPYLLANRAHLEAINNEWTSDTSEYFKMIANNMTIDATDMPFIKLKGCFDGNGLTVNNVSRCLFYESWNEDAPCVIKNLTVNANIARNSYFESAVLLYPDNDITMENVKVHGYIEGTAAASYIALGPNEVINYRFVNCLSDATVVATGEGAAGFIVHPYCKAGSTMTLEGSRYTGTMSAVGNTYYFRVNASGALTIHTDEADGASLYTNPAAEYTGKPEPDLYTSGGVKYKAGSKLTMDTITAPEGVSVITASKAEGASYAVATLNIGPNGTDEKGNYMGVFMKENCIESEGNYVTSNIKNFTVTVNGNATTETGVSADGTTYNIVRSTYGTTYGAAFVRIIQYSESGSIVKISTLNLKQ